MPLSDVLRTPFEEWTPEQHLAIEHGVIILGIISILIFVLLIYIEVIK